MLKLGINIKTSNCFIQKQLDIIYFILKILSILLFKQLKMLKCMMKA